MTATEYITDQLENCSHYQLSSDDRSVIESQGLETYIYSRLTSKKFRKWAVDTESERQVKRAIAINIGQGKPLQFRFPFGGYKLHGMPGSPEVDWAEFFSIAYYCKYLAPVAAAYEPGIEFKFSSDDVIIERMDNVPVADTNVYFDSFTKLLGQFGEHFPLNFKMDIVRISDLYDDKVAMEQELAVNVDKFKKYYADEVDPSKKDRMLKISALNIQWDGAKDLTGLSEAERQAIVDMGPVYHDAYCALSKRHEFNRGEDKIVIFTTVISNAIAIGTTKSSVTKYWTGFGVLETRGSNFVARILAPSQLAEWDKRPHRVERIDLLGSDNFAQLSVY